MQPLLSYSVQIAEQPAHGHIPAGDGLALGAPDTIRLVFHEKRNSVNVDLSASIGYTTGIAIPKKRLGRYCKPS